MVGCSGDEFASILRALGFRLERRKLEGGNGATPPNQGADASGDSAAAEAAPQTEEAEAAEPAFDEIWRPGKRKEASRPPRARGAKGSKPADAAPKRPRRHGKGQGGQGKGQDRGQDRGQARGRDRQRHAQPDHVLEHSPFAALKELRDSLAARGRTKES